MVAKLCVVINCPGNYKKLYKFPKDRKFEKRISKWLSAAGNKELLHLPEKLLLERAICNLHFEEKYFFRRGLARSAVPSLYLPDPIEVPLDHFSCTETTETEGDRNNGSNENGAIDEPSTSESTHITEDVQVHRNLKRSIQEKRGAVSTKRQAKGSILKIFNATAVNYLSKEDKKYYHVMVDMHKRIKQSNIQKQKYRKRLEVADNFINHNFWKTVPDHIRNLFLCYERNVSRKQNRRSFTLDEKIIALSIWKKSPKNYRFFQNLLLLPSTVTLKKLIMQLDIRPGLCNSVFEAMQKNIKSFTVKEKYCILIFDEISLSPGISYNASVDNVEGAYIDRQGTLQFADHATVWMLKGIYGARPWKQTVAFTYCNRNSTYLDVTDMFERIVTAADNIGLQVIASVCDQSTINVKAINSLVGNSSNRTILINNREIIPLYDVPHLMKCIRNNLLTKDLQFSLDGINWLTAKWEHIVGTYEIDKTNGPNRLLTKITDQHVKKECIKKMKVSCCTRVFSSTFAKIIHFYSNYKPIQGEHIIMLSPDPTHTASLLRFFNNLFDTLNNFYNENFNSNIYSRNLNTWNEGIKIISSMQYIKRKPKDKKHPVVLKSWIVTLQNIIKLNSKLKLLGINFAGRNFNQDAIENFFSLVRSHGGRNANPTCTSFAHYYKSIFINNFGRRISYKGNCEDDHSDYFIYTKHIINMKRQNVQIINNFNNVDIVFNSVNEAQIKNILVAVTKNIKSDCENCKLLYKASEVEKLFDSSLLVDICHSIITNNICENNLSQISIKFLREYIIFNTDHAEHAEKLRDNIFHKIFQYILNMYINYTNQILSGKLKNVDNLHLNHSQTPLLFDLAYKYYMKQKCKQKKK